MKTLFTILAVLIACSLQAQFKFTKAAPSLVTVPTKSTKQLSQDMAAMQKSILAVTGENKILKDSIALMNVRILAATNAANLLVKKVDALPKLDSIAVNKTPIGKLYVDYFTDPVTKVKTIQLKSY